LPEKASDFTEDMRHQLLISKLGIYLSVTSTNYETATKENTVTLLKYGRERYLCDTAKITVVTQYHLRKF
jgi:hypothetical protein